MISSLVGLAIVENISGVFSNAKKLSQEALELVDRDVQHDNLLQKVNMVSSLSLAEFYLGNANDAIKLGEQALLIVNKYFAKKILFGQH